MQEYLFRSPVCRLNASPIMSAVDWRHGDSRQSWSCKLGLRLDVSRMITSLCVCVCQHLCCPSLTRQHQSDLSLSGEELLMDIASYSPGIAGIDASTPTEDMQSRLRECSCVLNLTGSVTGGGIAPPLLCDILCCYHAVQTMTR